MSWMLVIMAVPIFGTMMYLFVGMDRYSYRMRRRFEDIDKILFPILPTGDEEAENNRIVERKEVPLFNQNAYREAVVNAFVHNHWLDGPPAFTVYKDRIEILSKGLLPPKQTMDGFFAGESVPVNEKLARIILQLHISEQTGRGVPAIVDAYGKDVFRFSENNIRVTIPFNRLENEINAAVIRENAPVDVISQQEKCTSRCIRHNVSGRKNTGIL